MKITSGKLVAIILVSLIAVAGNIAIWRHAAPLMAADGWVASKDAAGGYLICFIITVATVAMGTIFGAILENERLGGD